MVVSQWFKHVNRMFGMKIKHFNCLIIVAFLMASCTVPGPSTSTVVPTVALPTSSATRQDISADVLWLEANAIPFNTADPNSNLEDLMPLKKMIGNARIVALGEATHSTHEFFQMKYRMLEFLVQEMGFNTFAIEANWPEANLINTYLHTGLGDPAELLKNLSLGIWNTQEMLGMIQWMRAYNENPSNTKKISFFGFDMQGDQMARHNVAQYIQQVDSQAAQLIADDFSCIPQASADCQMKLQVVYDWLGQHQADYTAASSPEEFSQALQNARIVIQYGDYASKNNNYNIRDRYMAENVTWVLDQAGSDAKIVLWAHNFHVGMSGEEISQTMGDYLRTQYGNQMVVFGFLFYQGSFNAYWRSSLQTFQVDPPPTDSYESFFHEAGLPLFFLDLRSVKADSPAADWFLAPHPFRIIGTNYDPYSAQLYFETAVLAKVFDIVIYFQATSPALILK
jgi:erythromycin esterase